MLNARRLGGLISAGCPRTPITIRCRCRRPDIGSACRRCCCLPAPARSMTRPRSERDPHALLPPHPFRRRPDRHLQAQRPLRRRRAEDSSITSSATGAARNRPRWIVACSTSSGKSTATSTASSRSRSSPPTAPPPPTPCSAAAPPAWRASASICSAMRWTSTFRTCRWSRFRAAGLRLQRGGVGFYPTSGSPFVHLDTGSIRHWPRMTHDQLARVFPDGRTVHVPTDGNPLKGYELARADIEKRGHGDDAVQAASRASWPPCSRASRNEDDEEGAAPAVNEKPASASVVALRSRQIRREPVPMPRAKPQIAATLQLASADAQIVPAPKAKPAAAGGGRRQGRTQSRRRRPISSMPAASGATSRPLRSRRHLRRSPR